MMLSLNSFSWKNPGPNYRQQQERRFARYDIAVHKKTVPKRPQYLRFFQFNETDVQWIRNIKKNK